MVSPRHADAVAYALTQPGPWLDTFGQVRRRLADDAGCTIALLGPRGTGKTLIAAALIADTSAATLNARRYYTAADLFDLLRDAMQTGRTVEAKRDLCRLDLLVVDEAHERGGTSYEDRQLVGIVDHRYAHRRSTILAANSTAEAFAAAVGSSLMDRIREAGEIVMCSWPNFRANGQAAKAQQLTAARRQAEARQ